MSLPPYDSPSFFEKAECQGTSYDIFFPPEELALTYRKRLQSVAKAICNVCEVREECLAWAIDTNQGAGIWGGMTTRERQSIRNKQRREEAS